MVKSLILSGVMLLLTPVLSSAAAVSFVGTLTSIQSNGPGSLTVPIDFSGSLFAMDGASPQGITAGQVILSSVDPGSPFIFSLATAPTSAVTISSPTPTSSLVSFSIYTGSLFGGTLRNFTFNFTTPNPSTAVNQAKFDEFVGSTVNVTMTEFFGNGTVYNGTITATPEPGSLLAFSAIAATIGGVKLRRRAKVATATV